MMAGGNVETELLCERHVEYILSLEAKTKTSDALYFTDHKRLSGVYWALSSLALLNELDRLPKERILEYTLSCYDAERGMFSGNTDQDGHLLYTLSGIQILALYDELELVDGERVARAVGGLQQADGSFVGDEWGEVDSRFSYCALLTVGILGRMEVVDVEKAMEFVMRCVNFDGGFGCIPGAESHAGQVFCCLGALKLGCGEGLVDTELVGRWLCERQLECGGLNGRPDKLEDVCYSWWVLASLKMVDKMGWIDGERLRGFILRCQEEEGGIADRPGDMADVFHTFFGLGGLSLLGEEGVAKVDAVWALPVEVRERIERERDRDA